MPVRNPGFVKIKWIDDLRGIGIIAVILGHMSSPLSRFIYSWHIPLFFLASGLLIKQSRSIKESVKKDFTRLILPFYVFAVVGLLVEITKQFMFPHLNLVNRNLNLVNEIIGIFWWMDLSHLHHYGFVLWFLPALFWAKNLYLFLISIFKNKYTVTAISLLAIFLISGQAQTLPFGIDKGILGLFWLSSSWLITGRFWLFTLVFMLFSPIPLTNLAMKDIDGYGVFYSLIALNTIVGMSKLIPIKIKIFEKFGSESILLLVLHPYLNNLVYFVVIYSLGLGWLIEMVVVIFLLNHLLNHLETIKMVLAYIGDNNVFWKIPFKILVSFSVILFQYFVNIPVIKSLGKGRKLYIFPGSVVSRMFLYSDNPDKEEIELLRENVDRDTVFLDIGANIGSYSVQLSDLTKKIYAFEPSPDSHSLCVKNFILNGLNRRNVKKIALSNKIGTSGFTDFGGSSTVNRLSEDDQAKLTVKTDTLDHWTSANIKSRTNRIIVKIDVEGNDEKVLLGGDSILKKGRISLLIIEVFDHNSKVFSYLRSYGYKIGQISGNNYYAKKL